MVRPLGGGARETTGIYLPLEGHDVRPARFDPPDPAKAGDARTAGLLRDALQLGVRPSAGPFRSWAHRGGTRPYQLVPLLMALRMDPVRLLIADDVGIGKTVEASFVARELLDSGEIERMAVLCPPHLAEQWQVELAWSKFHLDAELVLSEPSGGSSGACAGESLFAGHSLVVADGLHQVRAAARRVPAHLPGLRDRR
ncbi:MAG: hypothetical protein U0237_19865 [Thermoleophilia bacterium]